MRILKGTVYLQSESESTAITRLLVERVVADDSSFRAQIRNEYSMLYVSFGPIGEPWGLHVAPQAVPVLPDGD